MYKYIVMFRLEMTFAPTCLSMFVHMCTVISNQELINSTYEGASN